MGRTGEALARGLRVLSYSLEAGTRSRDRELSEGEYHAPVEKL